ncbi:hypothetical protein SERLADRAFT_417238 [Serpula lacrymans var. lacrymans S7.9]|uniref:DUF6533 domain-containing protein n=1 Tax=Serpula lacrymans var. lacrymans (strain S7.9) TaxID=578457 RepID=F8P5B4_SERL9|nr:uncharacterized protein SERLADRAFT_417238 [Serpula lacrymans var. lacrymans S7.9]EGO21801.1 hypothetical protein SERLADRAFT_417238 [Serpula lacrymans var. lacrymans S7.9]
MLLNSTTASNALAGFEELESYVVGFIILRYSSVSATAFYVYNFSPLNPAQVLTVGDEVNVVRAVRLSGTHLHRLVRLNLSGALDGQSSKYHISFPATLLWDLSYILPLLYFRGAWADFSGHTGFLLDLYSIIAILQMRLFALYDHDKRVIITVTVLYIIILGTQLGMGIFEVHYYESQRSAEARFREIGICAGGTINWYALTWTPTMFYDFVLFVLAVFKSIRHHRQISDLNKSWLGINIINVMIRDSLLCFLMNFAVYFTSTILWWVDAVYLQEIIPVWQLVAPAVLATRLVVNIRRFYSDSHSTNITRNGGSIVHQNLSYENNTSGMLFNDQRVEIQEAVFTVAELAIVPNLLEAGIIVTALRTIRCDNLEVIGANMPTMLIYFQNNGIGLCNLHVFYAPPPIPQMGMLANSTSPAGSQESQSVLWNVGTIHYEAVAAVAFYVYDFMLTFGDGVEFIWGSPWSLVKISFNITLPLVSLLFFGDFNNYYYYKILSPQFPIHCMVSRIVLLASLFEAVISLIAVEGLLLSYAHSSKFDKSFAAILQMRLFALYDHDKRVTVPITVLFVIMACGLLSMSSFAIYNFNNSRLKSLQHYRQVSCQDWSRASIIKVMTRDSLLFFLSNFTLHQCQWPLDSTLAPNFHTKANRSFKSNKSVYCDSSVIKYALRMHCSSKVLIQVTPHRQVSIHSPLLVHVKSCDSKLGTKEDE